MKILKEIGEFFSYLHNPNAEVEATEHAQAEVQAELAPEDFAKQREIQKLSHNAAVHGYQQTRAQTNFNITALESGLTPASYDLINQEEARTDNEVIKKAGMDLIAHVFKQADIDAEVQGVNDLADIEQLVSNQHIGQIDYYDKLLAGPASRQMKKVYKKEIKKLERELHEPGRLASKADALREKIKRSIAPPEPGDDDKGNAGGGQQPNTKKDSRRIN